MYIEIKKDTKLPEDFIVGGLVNRDKYIVEMGFSDIEKWYNEHHIQPSTEIIGAIVIGSDRYNPIRYRIRTDDDERFDITKTTVGKIMSSIG